MTNRPRSRRLTVMAAWLALALAAWSGADAANSLRFHIQPEASEVGFYATSRFMNADGRFSRFTGDVVMDPNNPATAKVRVTIEAASIDTGIGMRDRHLRSSDFLDVDRYPVLKFESRSVEMAGRRATVTGDLTIHGVTREIAVPVDVQMSEAALVATGEFVVNRRHFGINYDSFFLPVGNDVRVSFTFRARAS
ncbi:MAG TPA: YceI family protein [Methylomirabilota bacterium]|nr:YceI family protein [Methylomirabilota bacterium]